MSLILQAYHQKSEAQETYVLGEPSPSYVHKDLFLINVTEIKWNWEPTQLLKWCELSSQYNSLSAEWTGNDLVAWSVCVTVITIYYDLSCGHQRLSYFCLFMKLFLCETSYSLNCRWWALSDHFLQNRKSPQKLSIDWSCGSHLTRLKHIIQTPQVGWVSTIYQMHYFKNWFKRFRLGNLLNSIVSCQISSEEKFIYEQGLWVFQQ